MAPEPLRTLPDWTHDAARIRDWPALTATSPPWSAQPAPASIRNDVPPRRRTDPAETVSPPEEPQVVAAKADKVPPIETLLANRVTAVTERTAPDRTTTAGPNTLAAALTVNELAPTFQMPNPATMPLWNEHEADESRVCPAATVRVPPAMEHVVAELGTVNAREPALMLKLPVCKSNPAAAVTAPEVVTAPPCTRSSPNREVFVSRDTNPATTTSRFNEAPGAWKATEPPLTTLNVPVPTIRPPVYAHAPATTTVCTDATVSTPPFTALLLAAPKENGPMLTFSAPSNNCKPD